MIISTLTEHVKNTKPSAFPDSTLLFWINELEAEIQTDVMLLAPANVKTHALPSEMLIADEAHTKIYWLYLYAMIDLANGELNRYQNSFNDFSEYMSGYKCWYATNYHPSDGRAETSGYYITAYSIAVKYGFSGTEADWAAATAADRNASAASATAAAASEAAAAASKTAAETAKTNAEAAKTAAANSATSAGNFASGAETEANIAALARSDAIAAKNAAETARDWAALSKSDAETAKTAATAAKTAAETAQTGAASSATAAASSEKTAASSKAAAETAKTAAETAKTNAEAAKTAAANSATSAGNFASGAETEANIAALARSDAIAAKNAAETARDWAALSKSDAETAKTAATAAKTAAETAKADAIAAKSSAETARDSAALSKTGAETAQTAAKLSQTAAETAKTAAETAKTGADNAKSGADASASAATTAKTDAVAAKTTAESAAAAAAKSAAEATAIVGGNFPTKTEAQGYATTAKQDAIATAGTALTAHNTATDAHSSVLATKADLVGGKIPANQLPAFVDDVLEFANFTALPALGESGKIYVTLDTNKTFRWSGSGYVEISASLALGETIENAYRGDRGKLAYEHMAKRDNPHGITPEQIEAAAKLHNHTKEQISNFPTSLMPDAHKSTHKIGGIDPITPGDIGAQVACLSFSITVPTTGWTAPSPALRDYTHCVNISVAGMLASYKPKIYLVPNGTTKQQVDAERDAFASIYELNTLASAVKIYGYGAPSVPLTLQLEV